MSWKLAFFNIAFVLIFFVLMKIGMISAELRPELCRYHDDMKVLEHGSESLRKQLKKMNKRNRKVYLNNIRQGVGGEADWFGRWYPGRIPSAMYPDPPGNQAHQLARCEPLPNLSKTEGTFE